MKSVIAAAGLVAVAQAFTPPVQPPSYGALLTPNTGSPVTTGQTYQVTWDALQPADGVTVSLVLCNGPSTNCVLQSNAIVENVPASAGSYSWSVPCSLPAGVQNTATGYGMLIIVDGTGQFQYSTQFSVNAGSSCGSSGSSSSSSTSSYTTTSSSSSSSPPSSTSSVSTPTAAASSGWNSWQSSSSMSTSTIPVPVVSSTPAAVTSSAPATQTYATYSSSSSSQVSTTPQAFTGAAAMPTAFVNAAGIFGAAALAALAL